MFFKLPIRFKAYRHTFDANIVNIFEMNNFLAKKTLSFYFLFLHHFIANSMTSRHTTSFDR